MALCTVAVLATPVVAQEDQADETKTPQVEEIRLLFTQTARSGKLKHPEGKDSRRFNLILKGVGRQVVWFQDRPGRQSGQIPLSGFVSEWAGLGFEQIPPNAALSLLDAPRDRDTVVLTLGIPRYKEGKKTLRYPVRIEDEATGNLSHLESKRDAAVPTRFSDASLFIDDGSAPVINGCVIQPYVICVGANLDRANLADANLFGADLYNADLIEANLSGADLQDASLPNANLTDANLADTTLVLANFTNADLSGADLSGAFLLGANLSNANLTDAIFCGTTMPDGSTNNSGC